jgi:hypothetical protein
VTLLRRLDAWAGLRLFHPPIIRFCQATGYTQHRLHRDMWFAYALWGTWRSAQDGDPWWMIAWLLLVCLGLGLSAAILPANFRSEGTLWIRVMAWALLLLGIPPLVMFGKWATPASMLWLLTAEYAATISDIPPREKREPRRKVARAEA